MEDQDLSGQPRILFVDDSAKSRLLIESALRGGGYDRLQSADSAPQAFEKLNLNEAGRPPEFDLILMDFLMPEIDGIEACRRIKADARFTDVPIIMVTAEESPDSLKEAFEAGAIDYVTKPINRIEMLARVKSALRLKQETDCRKERERQLMELNQKLERLSAIDGLTGIANRRQFDEALNRLWRRALRESSPISLIMIDIDHFKSYNDTYGHLAGDDCLRVVAQALSQTVKRPFDLVSRYGGEEFAVILPDTNREGAMLMAHEMRRRVEALAVPRGQPDQNDHVTVSAGVASLIPSGEPSSLIAAADACLYQAKRSGRNRVACTLETEKISA